MRLWAREEMIVGNEPAGLKAGQEVLNHYCDIRLPVQARREWASGALGGWCMCKRCRDEAAAGDGAAAAEVEASPDMTSQEEDGSVKSKDVLQVISEDVSMGGSNETLTA